MSGSFDHDNAAPGAGPERTPRTTRTARRTAATGLPYTRPSSTTGQRQDKGSVSGFLLNFISSPFRRAVQSPPPSQPESIAQASQDGPPPSDTVEVSSSSSHEDSNTFSNTGAPTSQPTFFSPPAHAKALTLPRSISAPRGRETAQPEGINRAATANEKLARFFAEKGESPLTEVEAEGVLKLLQESNGGVSEQRLASPSFIPHFTPSKPSDRQLFQPSQSLVTSSTAGSLFPLSSSSTAAIAPRRKAIYLGPGRSSAAPSVASAARRKRALGSSQARRGGLFGSGYELATRYGSAFDIEGEGSGAGKRRKVDEPSGVVARAAGEGEAAGKHQDRFPPAPVNTAAAPFPPAHAPPSKPATDMASPVKVKGPVNGLKLGSKATPARPSPLRKMVQADTPSPPPKPASLAGSPAAGVMLSVIRASAAEPKVVREEVINPYATRSRTVPHKGGKGTAAALGAAKRKVLLDKKRQEDQEKPQGAERTALSVEEIMERTMPLEYRPKDEFGRPLRKHYSSSSGSGQSKIPTPTVQANKILRSTATSMANTSRDRDNNKQEHGATVQAAPTTAESALPLGQADPTQFSSASSASASPAGMSSPLVAAFGAGTAKATGGRSREPFGSAAAPAEKSAFSFSVQAPSKEGKDTPGFTFGASATASPFSYGTPGKTDTDAAPFQFGASLSMATAKDIEGVETFTFGDSSAGQGPVPSFGLDRADRAAPAKGSSSTAATNGEGKPSTPRLKGVDRAPQSGSENDCAASAPPSFGLPAVPVSDPVEKAKQAALTLPAASLPAFDLLADWTPSPASPSVLGDEDEIRTWKKRVLELEEGGKLPTFSI